jgi:hypothetical protein
MDLPITKEQLLHYQQVGRYEEEKGKRMAIMTAEITKLINAEISKSEKKYVYYHVVGNPLTILSNGANIETEFIDHLKNQFVNCEVYRMSYSAFVTISWE